MKSDDNSSDGGHWIFQLDEQAVIAAAKGLEKSYNERRELYNQQGLGKVAVPLPAEVVEFVAQFVRYMKELGAREVKPAEFVVQSVLMMATLVLAHHNAEGANIRRLQEIVKQSHASRLSAQGELSLEDRAEILERVRRLAKENGIDPDIVTACLSPTTNGRPTLDLCAKCDRRDDCRIHGALQGKEQMLRVEVPVQEPKTPPGRPGAN
jgi:hypothetical protein